MIFTVFMGLGVNRRVNLVLISVQSIDLFKEQLCIELEFFVKISPNYRCVYIYSLNHPQIYVFLVTLKLSKGLAYNNGI